MCMPECDLKTPCPTTPVEPLVGGKPMELQCSCVYPHLEGGSNITIWPSNFALSYTLLKYANFVMAILFLCNVKQACCCAKTMSICRFCFDVHTEYISRAKHTKYYLKRDNKHTSE